jgi:DNA modification methylase
MTDLSVKLAYADPPYFGHGKLYNDTPEAAQRSYDDLDSWADLIADLSTQHDGWALSMTSNNLHHILPLCPKEARIASWVKPFAAFKRNVRIAYTWEPVVFVPGRDRSIEGALVNRDHLSEPITMKKGLTGAKPERFCRWVLDLMGFVPGDVVTDVFPGTGIFGRVAEAAQVSPLILRDRAGWIEGAA